MICVFFPPTFPVGALTLSMPGTRGPWRDYLASGSLEAGKFDLHLQKTCVFRWRRLSVAEGGRGRLSQTVQVSVSNVSVEGWFACEARGPS